MMLINFKSTKDAGPRSSAENLQLTLKINMWVQVHVFYNHSKRHQERNNPLRHKICVKLLIKAVFSLHNSWKTIDC